MARVTKRRLNVLYTQPWKRRHAHQRKAGLWAPIPHACPVRNLPGKPSQQWSDTGKGPSFHLRALEQIWFPRLLNLQPDSELRITTLPYGTLGTKWNCSLFELGKQTGLREREVQSLWGVPPKGVLGAQSTCGAYRSDPSL